MTNSARIFGNMTWPEIRDAGAANDVILLPVGMIEQHGPYLPVNADSLVADWVATRVSEQTGAVVAPSIAYGHSPVLRGYPGTLHIRAETLRRLVSDVVGALVDHGFRRIVLLNNHAGNLGPLTEVALTLRRELGILMGYAYPWELGYRLMRDQYEDADAVFGHGAEPERSALLTIAPELVRPAEDLSTNMTGFDGWRPTGYLEAAVPGHSLSGTIFWDFSEVSDTGAVGKLNAGNADIGQVWVDRVVGFIVDFVRLYDANTRDAGWANRTTGRVDRDA